MEELNENTYKVFRCMHNSLADRSDHLSAVTIQRSL